MKNINIYRICFFASLVLVLSIAGGCTKKTIANNSPLPSNTTAVPASTANIEQTAEYVSKIYQAAESAASSPMLTEAPTSAEKQNQSETGVKNGICFNVTSSAVLWERNADDRIAPASLTKLLTAYTALKYVSPETVFTVGSEQSLLNPHSSLCLLQKGHRLKLYDLLCGMLIASGNDAAYTVAVNTARAVCDIEMTEEEALGAFCDLMNASAREIGMNNSFFCSPDGFDNSEQYTTVNDLLKLSLWACQNDVIKDITSQAERYVVFESGENITWQNTNLLINKGSKYYCPYATGLKTGSTASAGKCLIASARKNGNDYIVIVTGCETDSERYGLALQLLNDAP